MCIYINTYVYLYRYRILAGVFLEGCVPEIQNFIPENDSHSFESSRKWSASYCI